MSISIFLKGSRACKLCLIEILPSLFRDAKVEATRDQFSILNTLFEFTRHRAVSIEILSMKSLLIEESIIVLMLLNIKELSSLVCL